MIDQRSRWYLGLLCIWVACGGADRIAHTPDPTPFIQWLGTTQGSVRSATNLLTFPSFLTSTPTGEWTSFQPFLPPSPPPLSLTPAPSQQITSTSPPYFDTLPRISPENAAWLAQIDEVRFSPWNLVMALAWSPDGKTLVISAGEYIYWYDVATMQVKNYFRVGAFTHALAFSSNGRWLAAGSRDGILRVWDSLTNMEIAEVHPVLIIQAHKKGVNSVAFSPDGHFLASGGNDAVARFWDLANGELLGLMIGGTFAVPAIAFTPDGSSLAVVNGNVIRLREVGSERIIGTITAEGPLFSLAISPDGQVLAAGDLENLVQLWDPAKAFRTGREEYPEPVKLVGHNGKTASFRALIWKVVFSPDGRLLASAGGDATLRLWDVATGELVATLQGQIGGVTCVAFRPDGRSLASGGLDGTLRLWEIDR